MDYRYRHDRILRGRTVPTFDSDAKVTPVDKQNLRVVLAFLERIGGQGYSYTAEYEEVLWIVRSAINGTTPPACSSHAEAPTEGRIDPS